MKAISSFEALIAPLQQAIAGEGYTTPTPIQQQTIPHLLAGRDVLGCAQTGTGKTAAFTLPLLQALTSTPNNRKPGHPRALILTPTRELAAQIGQSIATYGQYLQIRHTVIFGGVGQMPQERALRQGVDIVVATPGRLLDLMQQRHICLDAIEIFVLDEADRMLDMGFMPSVRRIIAPLPRKRHSLFFSATMPPVVAALAKELLHAPVHITVDPESPTVDRIAQKVMFVDKGHKDALLVDVIQRENMAKVIVFTRTKHGADRVVRKLAKADVSAHAIHGNKSQNARTRALEQFRLGRVRALVATDIAARGIDVDGITHVINFDVPQDAESYVHRIGRTARAGSSGSSISFCSAREREALRGIESLIRKPVPVETAHPWHSKTAREATGTDARPEPRGQRPPRRSRPGPTTSRAPASRARRAPHRRRNAVR